MYLFQAMILDEDSMKIAPGLWYEDKLDLSIDFAPTEIIHAACTSGSGVCTT